MLTRKASCRLTSIYRHYIQVPYPRPAHRSSHIPPSLPARARLLQLPHRRRHFLPAPRILRSPPSHRNRTRSSLPCGPERSQQPRSRPPRSWTKPMIRSQLYITRSSASSTATYGASWKSPKLYAQSPAHGRVTVQGAKSNSPGLRSWRMSYGRRPAARSWTS